MYRLRLTFLLWALTLIATACATDPSTVSGFGDVTEDTNAVTPIDASDSRVRTDFSLDALGGDGTADLETDSVSDVETDSADIVESDPDLEVGDIADEDAPLGDAPVGDVPDDADSVDTHDSTGDTSDVADTSDRSDLADSSDLADAGDVVPDEEPDLVDDSDVPMCDPDEDSTGVRGDDCDGLGLDAPIRMCLGHYEEQGDTTFLDVIVENDVPISGFQFKVSGVTLAGSLASGGRTGAANLTVTALSATGVVLVFDGDREGEDEVPVPAGSGTLITLEFESKECTELCLIPTVKFSDADANAIAHDLGPCYSF